MPPYVRTHAFTTHILDQPSSGYHIMGALFNFLSSNADTQQYLSNGWKSAVELLNRFLQGKPNTTYPCKIFPFLICKGAICIHLQAEGLQHAEGLEYKATSTIEGMCIMNSYQQILTHFNILKSRKYLINLQAAPVFPNNALLMAELQILNLSAIDPTQEGLLGSLCACTSTELIFFNKHTTKVVLYWLDYNGQRKEYQRIYAGRRSAIQQTYKSHPWVVVAEESQEVLGIWRP